MKSDQKIGQKICRQLNSFASLALQIVWIQSIVFTQQLVQARLGHVSQQSEQHERQYRFYHDECQSRYNRVFNLVERVECGELVCRWQHIVEQTVGADVEANCGASYYECVLKEERKNLNIYLCKKNERQERNNNNS